MLRGRIHSRLKRKHLVVLLSFAMTAASVVLFGARRKSPRASTGHSTVYIVIWSFEFISEVRIQKLVKRFDPSLNRLSEYLYSNSTYILSSTANATLCLNLNNNFWF